MSSMLTQIDNQYMQGAYVNFKDEGKPTSPNAKTHIYSVTSRVNNAFLGYVRWFSQWRRYCYFTVDCILDEKCLTEIARFCGLKTEEQKADWKPPYTVSQKHYDGRR